uniref:Uncharacterized protein n=1 Tax=Megaselia scalaris TaxID=36166 RepID=T1H226_MEGSC
MNKGSGRISDCNKQNIKEIPVLLSRQLSPKSRSEFLAVFLWVHLFIDFRQAYVTPPRDELFRYADDIDVIGSTKLDVESIFLEIEKVKSTFDLMAKL